MSWRLGTAALRGFYGKDADRKVIQNKPRDLALCIVKSFAKPVNEGKTRLDAHVLMVVKFMMPSGPHTPAFAGRTLGIQPAQEQSARVDR